MSRFAQHFPVCYIEAPIYDGDRNFLDISSPIDGIRVIVPRLKEGLSEEQSVTYQKEMLARLFIDDDITQYLFWYYTPMALAISDHLNPTMIVYDCVAEPSASGFAPPDMKDREKELLNKADLVFTGGYSLYEAKKNRHPDVHAFPNSIDSEHYSKARVYNTDPADQATIPHPRLGYFGVIDERMDLSLIENVARRKPEWHLVMVGPVSKISVSALPALPNIHYLGMKKYDELPAYISGWDIAILPFAHNDATRYISPTKTPEYLAAARPVISTPIIDVLRQYGNSGLVNIAGTPEEFVRVASLELENHDREEWLRQVDEFLAHNSWDKTWQRMMYHVTRKLTEKERDMKAASERIYG